MTVGVADFPENKLLRLKTTHHETLMCVTAQSFARLGGEDDRWENRTNALTDMQRSQSVNDVLIRLMRPVTRLTEGVLLRHEKYQNKPNWAAGAQ